MTIHISIFWSIYLSALSSGLVWALWPRQDEKATGGAYSMPDIFSPLLRLCGVLIAALTILLVRSAI